MEIEFSKHALSKIELLRDHGFQLDKNVVAAIARSHGKIEKMPTGEEIAQDALDDTHVLRVVFRRQGAMVRVITVYPGRKKRYENQL